MEAFFGVHRIERDDSPVAAFFRRIVIVCIGEKPAQAGEKERAQPAFVLIRSGEKVLFQNTHEEALGEVFRIVR